MPQTANEVLFWDKVFSPQETGSKQLAKSSLQIFRQIVRINMNVFVSIKVITIYSVMTEIYSNILGSHH